jgi:hypothetical protein
MARTIKNTTTEAQHEWPMAVFIQGGERGVVFGGPDGAYQTSFFEAFPAGTFLRGEGKTLAEAEESAWEQYQRYLDCDGKLGFGEWHGPYERRQYRNGAGFCARCGIWMNRVLEPLPKEPKPERRTILDRVFTDREPEAIAEVLEAIADSANLPHAPSGD